MTTDHIRAHTPWNRLRHLTQKYFWSVNYYGLTLTMAGSVINVYTKVRTDKRLVDWYKERTSRRFDKRFNVNTLGVVTVEELDITEAQRTNAHHYQATAAVTFGVVLSELMLRYQDYTFVDYGSGKGRTLIQAAFFPFKAILGVEISSTLHQAAQTNIARLNSDNLRCKNITSVCADATQFALPNEPLVLYFFHPFNEVVLEQVLKNLRGSLAQWPRHCIVVYQGPVYNEALAAADPRARRVVGAQLKRVFEGADFLRTAPMRFSDPRWGVYESISS